MKSFIFLLMTLTLYSCNEATFKFVKDGGLQDTPNSAYTFQGLVSTLVGPPGSPVMPYMLTSDSLGNIYFVETNFHMIMKLSSSGQVSVFAGKFLDNTYVDGAGSVARFNSPFGIAVDSQDNVFVADLGNHVVRKITPSGFVSTYAGNQLNSADGTGSLATVSFLNPIGLAIDANDNIYVTDSGHNNLKRITPAGVVTTLATSGNGVNQPVTVAVDAAGNSYITSDHSIMKITSTGVSSVLAGNRTVSGYIDDTGANARFHNPIGLVVRPNGDVFVADALNGCIRKISPAGVVTTYSGDPLDKKNLNGSVSSARFMAPYGLNINVSGELLLIDLGTGNSALKKISSGVVSTMIGPGIENGPRLQSRLYSPSDLALDSQGNIFISDTGNHVIRKVTSQGVVSTFAGGMGVSGAIEGPGLTARFSSPIGIAIDKNDVLYVADSGNRTIRKILPDGTVSTYAGQTGTQGSLNGARLSATFYNPSGIVVDPDLNIYLSDSVASTIRKIAADGTVSTFAGQSLTNGDLDGPGTSAQFHTPAGIDLDSDGFLYVADSYNHTVRRISPAGLVETFAGDPGNSGYMDSIGGAALFNGVIDVEVDKNNNVYVVDPNNMKVRKITPLAEVTTISGNDFFGMMTQGPMLQAGYLIPRGINIDSQGRIYIVDAMAHNIRIIQ